jgi:hypothetical protein
MKSYKELVEKLVSEGHDRYPGDDMTQKELKIAINAAKNILEMLDDGAELMRWQISAIVKASDELASVCTSMKADEEDDEWEDDEDEEPMYVGFEYPRMYGEEVELIEEIGDYSIKKTGEKKSTSAHPEGKPIHNILHKGEVVGTIEPYSAYREKKKPGSRIVTSRTNVTKYSVHFHAGKGPTKSADMPLYHKLGHSTPASALNSAAQVHTSWKTKTEEVEQLDEAKHYLVGVTGNNLTGHTSQPHFNSHDDAMSYQKKFKHVPAIKKAKIVKGTSDKHGFVTPVKEEVEQIDEISTSTLRSYIDKARASRDAAKKERTSAKSDMKNYGMSIDKERHDSAQRKMVNRAGGISTAHKKLGTYPTDKAKARVMAREEVELDEAIIQGSKEHLAKLKDMLDKVKPGSPDHSQIRGAISAMFGDQHIPAKHRNVKTDFYEELDFKVSVDGLPDMYVKANSPAEVKASLRKVIRKPDTIQSVDRVTQTMLKKIFRDKAMGKEDLDEAVHNVVDQIKTSKSPYKKASEALHDSSKTHRREDKWELEMHAKLLSSENPADHKKSAEYVKNLDHDMKKHISNLVHINSSAEHSAKWHSHAGIKRVNEETEVDESSFVAKAAHAKVAGDSSFRLKGDEKEYPVTIKAHHARKIKRNIEE